MMGLSYKLGRKTTLLGVVPASKGISIRSKTYCYSVTYPGSKQERGTQLDPNHSHFLMVNTPKGWGGETAGMFSMASYIHQTFKSPVCCFLSNGGEHSLTEISFASEKKWPMYVALFAYLT
jgi:hypothetical protein